MVTLDQIMVQNYHLFQHDLIFIEIDFLIKMAVSDQKWSLWTEIGLLDRKWSFGPKIGPKSISNDLIFTYNRHLRGHSLIKMAVMDHKSRFGPKNGRFGPKLFQSLIFPIDS